MPDTDRTRDQLAAELAELRQQFHEQTHRLSLQAAVERIRAEALSMRSSDDLLDVVGAMYREVQLTGVPRSWCNIWFIDEEKDWSIQYSAGPNWKKLDPEWTPSEEFATGTRELDDDVGVTRSDPSKFSEWDTPQKEAWVRQTSQISTWTLDTAEWPASPKIRNFFRGEHHSLALPFTNGVVQLAQRQPIEAEDVELMQSFTAALSFGFQRYLDFMNLEQQNRNLEVERSAERVRAATLAMRTREDFLNVAAVLARQMGELGFESPGCNITFIDEESGYGADYVALRNPRQYGASWNNPSVVEIDDDYIVFVREATVFTVFGAEEFTVPGWRESGSRTVEIPPQMIQDFFGDVLGIEFPPELIGTDTRIGTAIYFSHGKVGFNESEYHEEHTAIMRQLVDALALGVVRFIDFQKVEQAQQKLIDDLEEELQTAHDMQMNLMPIRPPQIEGVDIAGRCLTANHVGGDFFQYFPQDGKLSLTLADVTGHAMEAAIPAVMFSGILDNQMEIGGTLEELFTRLNRSMYRNLDDRTFVCFTAAELDLQAHTARLANGGCPYPYHYRAATSDIVELQVEAYPLGVQAASSYPVIEVSLSPGDRLVLCSDGIVEATNSDDELFGFDRTAAAIQEGCRQDLSSESLIEFVFTRLAEFTGDAPREDDQTIVVLRCADEG